MKTCLAIGDLFVAEEDMRRGLQPLTAQGYAVDTDTFCVGDFDALQAFNHEVETVGPGGVDLPANLRERMLGADMLVVHFCPVPGALIREHGHLGLIGTCRTGTSNIDTDAADACSVPVINCSGRLADAVADFAVGALICEARNIARGHLALKHGEWRRRYRNLGNIPDLPGRTVGLVGLGAIGRGVADRLSGFRMRVIAYDPYVNPAAATRHKVELVDLDTLMRESDFVSVHVDLRPETRLLIDRRRLGLMKPTAYLINTARAGVVDETALVKALESDHLAGAALDVFESEPPGPDHPLLQLDNVTLTPHMAGGSDDAFRRSPALLCKRLLEETAEPLPQGGLRPHPKCGST